MRAPSRTVHNDGVNREPAAPLRQAEGGGTEVPVTSGTTRDIAPVYAFHRHPGLHIPVGAEFEVLGPPEFVDLIHEWAPTAVGTSAEHPALNLPPVVFEGLVQMDRGRLRRRFGVTVTDGPVDGHVLLDRFGRVTSDGTAQPDRAGLTL